MRRAIFCNSVKCTGCQICEIVCSVIKENKLNTNLSRIHVVRDDPYIQMAVTCQLCERAPCVESCPRALAQSKDGVVSVDMGTHVLCGSCVRACPFGAITMNSSNIQVCDLCDGKPGCVEHCPKDALIFASLQDITHSKRSRLIAQLIGELSNPE